MNTTMVIQRLRSAPKYAYWHATIQLLRNQKSGPKAARLGHALRQVGRWSDAESAYRGALTDSDNPPDVQAPSHWYHGLSIALAKQNKIEEAYRASLTACTGETPPIEHSRQLRMMAKAVDSKPGIIIAGQQIRRSGSCWPGLLRELAESYEAMGHWAEAKEALTSLVRTAPDNAKAQYALGRVSTLLAKWQGTFTGPIDDSGSIGEFKPIPATGRESDLTVEGCRKSAIKAFEQATRLNPRRTSWHSALGEAKAVAGDLEGSIRHYEEALRITETTNGVWAFAVKHRWQYKVESAYSALGKPRTTDPHFDCAVSVPEDAAPATRGKIPGLFTAQITYSGLHFSGVIADPECRELVIALDGITIRRVKVDKTGYLGNFVYAASRSSLPSFPTCADITVTTADGQPLQAAGGGDRMRLSIPHGDGSAVEFARSGRTLDKKGGIPQTPEQTRERQNRYLQTYAKVREFFENTLDKSLFLLYGTLLGYHREGDFIVGDDDFDGGWISDRTDPESVKAETFDIVVELVKAGFVISFNRRGRLFRAQLPGDIADDVHLDLRPVWFQDGKVWLHNHCVFTADRDDFLPTATGTLRNVEVSVPADTEKFLRNHYGPGWKTPDPGFTYYLSGIDSAVLGHLAQALITPDEFRALAERVERETADIPTAGKFISVGSQEFYPLEDFIG